MCAVLSQTAKGARYRASKRDNRDIRMNIHAGESEYIQRELAAAAAGDRPPVFQASASIV